MIGVFIGIHVHILQLTSLTWHQSRNTCWFGYNCVIDCYSWFCGCLHILCYGAWLSFEQSLLVTLLVLCFALCASLAGLLVLSMLLLYFAKQLVRHLLWFRSSHCPSSTMCSCLRLSICSSHLVGFLSYIRTINMKAVTFSIQAIDD